MLTNNSPHSLIMKVVIANITRKNCKYKKIKAVAGNKALVNQNRAKEIVKTATNNEKTSKLKIVFSDLSVFLLFGIIIAAIIIPATIIKADEAIMIPVMNCGMYSINSSAGIIIMLALYHKKGALNFKAKCSKLKA